MKGCKCERCGSEIMKVFVALVTIQAETEGDFLEQIAVLGTYELEWYKEVTK